MLCHFSHHLSSLDIHFHLTNDEDNGSMSAWYIFAQLGVYPVCPGMPGTDGYAKTDMLVKSAKILGKAWSPDALEAFI